jgi:transcriptional regulator with XRE-family HTH domain
MVNESIGSRVRRLRQERGLGQEQLALKAHVDQSSLSKFERSGKGLGPVPLQRIAQVLELTLESMVQDTDFVEGGRRTS